MQVTKDAHRTMYIKFPTVTKLVYPSEQPAEQAQFRSTSYRSNISLHSKIKLNLISKTQSFKIVQLPERNEIMNIRTMAMQKKQKSEDKEKQGSVSERSPRKKIFSTCKFNTLKVQAETQSPAFINPLKPKKSASVSAFKKKSGLPMTNFQYPELYTQIYSILGLSYGLVVVNEGFIRTRKARIDQGNNSLLIKQVIKKRMWWNAVNQDQKINQGDTINLLWTQNIISQKNISKLMDNNQQCMKAESRKYEDLKPAFQRTLDKAIRQLPKVKQLFYTQWEEQPLRFKDLIFKWSHQPQRILNPDNLILNNHIPNNWQITNKKLLYKNMVEYYQKLGLNPNEKIPKTYHITCFNWQEVIKDVRGDISRWILKPGEFTNRGRGITVFKSTKDAIDYILMHPPKTQERTFLLQEYIMPMLYLDRKFDIRAYMLGIQIGKQLKFFWYEEGYIRTATEKFSLHKVSKSIHLTNDSIQKNMKNYGEHQTANKLSYTQIDKYMTNNTSVNFYSEILPEMKRISRDICHAVGDTQKIGAEAGISFEVYGLDYLVDNRGQPWLIEVNTNPSFEVSCSLLSRLIPEMVQNSCRLVCDLLLPPKKVPDYAQHFLLNNRFALIYSREPQTVQQ